MSEIREYPNIRIAGTFREKTVLIYAWQITGRVGNLTIDMIQPAEGQSNAYTDFLARHGDGILSIVHEAPDQRYLENEVTRMKKAGVGVLQQATAPLDRTPVTYLLFDTEREGKFALGLVYTPRRTRAADGPAAVPHFGAAAWDVKASSAYWARLGFERLDKQFELEWTSPGPSDREGIEHIAVPVADLSKSIAALERLGYHVEQSSTRVAGIVVDLVQNH